MSRRAARENALKIIYNCALMKEPPDDVCAYLEETYQEEGEMWAKELSEGDVEYMRQVVFGAAENKDEINSAIEPLLKRWHIERLPKMSLALLQMAIYEIDNVESVPDKVAVNEAVELAKMYGEGDTYKFINGVLAQYLKQKNGSKE